MPTDNPLIAAALALADSGQRVTVQAVADRASVSRSQVYRRLGGRPAILNAIAHARGLSAKHPAARPTRDRILDALDQHLQDTGLRGLTLERIAQRAGLGVATLYRHFPNRAALLSAFAAARRPNAMPDRPLDTHPAALADSLHRFAAEHLRWAKDHRLLLAQTLARAPDSAQLLAALERRPRARDRLHAFFERCVQRGTLQGDPALMTRLFIGMILGLALLDRPTVALSDSDAAETLTHALIATFNGAH